MLISDSGTVTVTDSVLSALQRDLRSESLLPIKLLGHVGVGKREVRGGEERGVGGGARRAEAGEVETPAMAAEAGRETRRGAESDEESDGCDGAQDSERVSLRNTHGHILSRKALSFAPRS